KVQLLVFNNPLAGMWELFTNDDHQSLQFRKSMRAYNNTLSSTSLGTTKVPYQLNDGGTYPFRIKGALYHNHGALVPVEGERPKFGQIYVHDSMDVDAQIALYLNIFSNNSLDGGILADITATLQDHNWLVQTYETAREILKSNSSGTVNLQLKILDAHNRDSRVYNVLTSDEIGIIIIGDGDEDFDKQDIVIKARGSNDHPEYPGLTRILELNPYYLPLHYLLLLINGELGWRTAILLRGNDEAIPAYQEIYRVVTEEDLIYQQWTLNPTTARGVSKHVSLAMWHCYHLFECVGVQSLLHYGGRLFQEWGVDAAAVNEQNNLR
ncbi:hypothetical protein L873DRAFT_1688310, partial [Choiromyces venosus 120613-1]